MDKVIDFNKYKKQKENNKIAEPLKFEDINDYILLIRKENNRNHQKEIMKNDLSTIMEAKYIEFVSGLDPLKPLNMSFVIKHNQENNILIMTASSGYGNILSHELYIAKSGYIELQMLSFNKIDSIETTHTYDLGTEGVFPFVYTILNTHKYHTSCNLFLVEEGMLYHNNETFMAYKNIFDNVFLSSLKIPCILKECVYKSTENIKNRIDESVNQFQKLCRIDFNI